LKSKIKELLDDLEMENIEEVQDELEDK